MAELRSFRRVLIVADESADWIVAGLRQLERLALSVDEFASENTEAAPVHVCIFWRPNLDQVQRWVPKNEKLARVAFTTDHDGSAYDLVLSTRLFLYRKAMRELIEASVPAPETTSSTDEMEVWEKHFRQVESLPQSRAGAWEYITDGDQIDGIEKRFLRGSGKSQDGLVSRYLNRPISRMVTRLLLQFLTTPNAWTLLIFPIPIIAVILMLFSQRARANSAMFLLGWIVGVLGVTVVALVIANTQDLTQSNGQAEDSVSTVKLVLGVLLILLAARDWRGRPKEGETPTLPKYLEAIDTLTPPKALGLGLLLSAANPKSLVLIVAGALTISQADLSDGDTVVAVLVFVVIAVSTVVAPVVLYNVMGERAQPVLNSMRAWLTQNNATVMAVLLLVIGVVVIGKAIAPIID
jgi:threonine/homoserine/homoserine lactone efflux protein